MARKLAEHMVSETNGFIETVQFHPAYDYADFVEGIRPNIDSEGQMAWANRPGVFLKFCRKAQSTSAICVMIIDEMNRGNLARIFGELMMLIEYRDDAITLPSGEYFIVPDNVRIIGTMNTADRSIALIDHALRRRFACMHMAPDFRLIEKYHQTHETGFAPGKLINLLGDLNRDIADPAYSLGVSYFLTPSLQTDLPQIWQTEIEPYLEEYFFNQPDKVKKYRWANLSGSLV